MVIEGIPNYLKDNQDLWSTTLAIIYFNLNFKEYQDEWNLLVIKVNNLISLKELNI